MTLVTGGVVAVAAIFFIDVWAGGPSDTSGPSSSDPWVQGQVDDQPQKSQLAGVSVAQKFQILHQFCTQQVGGPTDVDEAALLERRNSY